MVESHNSNEILSSNQKRGGFHAKYLKACKAKNLAPLPEVKAKNRNINLLDFHADRVRPYDWIAICNSLYSDKTLKTVAIRLRNNKGNVIDELNTLKKVMTLINHPVIYSRFLMNELVQSLQSLTMNSPMLETLTLEGLPMTGSFMTIFAKGFAHNNSVKNLSFARGNIGDEACEIICATLKYMKKIEILNVSGCELSVKGATAIAELIKYQKIQRFSEAWENSLRYQNNHAISEIGLTKILLNNNPEIRDQGLEIITEVLCEDAWMKEIEMQSCGLTDSGAQNIINCININKSISIFNIAGNANVSEHLHRHILISLGTDQDSSVSSDSSKSSSENVSKYDLLDKLKFLEEQLEMEVFRRKKIEALNEKLHEQLVEAQKEISCQGSFRIPDGFTIVTNETLNKLLKENDFGKIPSYEKRHRPKRIIKPRKVISSLITKPPTINYPVSRSDTTMVKTPKNEKKPFIERSIGDTNCNTPAAQTSRMTGAELLQMFTKKKRDTSQQPDNLKLPKNFDPRSLFTNSAKKVPQNSDVESDSSSETIQ